MKISRAVDFHLQYHRANSEKNTFKTSQLVLSKFAARFCDRELASISQEEVLDFLLNLTKHNKHTMKRYRYSVLSSFYNFSINTGLPSLANTCNTTIIKKIFKRPPAIQWQIVDKDTIDEIIFRTTNKRNRLMLELMARGGMRIGEVLKLAPDDIQESSLSIQNPKSGRKSETVYVLRKIMGRLSQYVQAAGISSNNRILPSLMLPPGQW